MIPRYNIVIPENIGHIGKNQGLFKRGREGGGGKVYNLLLPLPSILYIGNSPDLTYQV